MQTFVDAEDAYLAWVGRHTDGYVLNAGRTEAPSQPVVLHGAACWSISGAYPNYTTRDLHQGLLAGPGRVGALGRATSGERLPQLPLLPRLTRR